MRKNFIFSILLVALFIGLNLSVVSQTVADNEVVTVENLMLEETKVTLACPFKYNYSNREPCPVELRQTMIATVSPSAEKNGWTYYYFVTGGKIIGEGANVVWDFTGSKPGDYSITVGVGKDGILKGNTISRNVIAESCECHPPCICPRILVSAPNAPAKRNDILVFTANLSGGTQDKATFNWMVSDGKIIQTIETESKSQILVKLSAKTKSKQITAIVEVSGLCAPECPNTESAIIQIKK